MDLDYERANACEWAVRCEHAYGCENDVGCEHVDEYETSFRCEMRSHCDWMRLNAIDLKPSQSIVDLM